MSTITGATFKWKTRFIFMSPLAEFCYCFKHKVTLCNFSLYILCDFASQDLDLKMYRYLLKKKNFLESYFLQRIMKKRDLNISQVSVSLLELIKATAAGKQTNISTFTILEK